MAKDRARWRAVWSTIMTLYACSDDDSGSMVDSANAGAQTPPMGAAEVEAWLAAGSYKSWHCESAAHAARAPSPHGFNRICSNDLIASEAAGTGAWPRGAAAVKELYASASGGAPTGYAVYLKTADDSQGGASWYWYERIDTNTVADGLGGDGPPKTICVACHGAAGSDAAHTPSLGGRDQVYTAVQ